MTESTPLQKATGLMERDLGDALVVMTGEGQMLHTLKGTGLFLWKLLDGNRGMADLVAALTSEFEVARPRAEADVSAFVDALRQARLLA